jgi:soluble lytic murein transglycosylase
MKPSPPDPPALIRSDPRARRICSGNAPISKSTPGGPLETRLGGTASPPPALARYTRFGKITEKLFSISVRQVGLALLAGGALIAPAHAEAPILIALHAQDWKTAEALAANEKDPVALDLVKFARLLTPGQATAQEIYTFATAHGDWPDRGVLHRRLAEAVLAETDAAQRLQDCQQYKPGGEAVLRCAEAERGAGHASQADWLARQAWIDGITEAGAEQDFLAHWAAAIRPEDQWRRFDALDWTGNAAADRQAARLDTPRHALAAARLAFRHNDPRALDYLPAVPEALRADPSLLLYQARWLRSTGAKAAALALWRAAGAPAEQAAAVDRRPAFWSERDRLARLLLADGDNDGAYFLADDAAAGPDQAPDALYLCGWIALRRQHDAARAIAKFQALHAVSQSIITQGRAWYWMGRAAATEAEARQDFVHAAAYPTSYYGQLAALRFGTAAALTAQLAALHDPVPDDAATKAFAANGLTHAADLLAGWGDAGRARAFLRREAQTTQDPGILELTAQHALALQVPDVAVATARLAGRQGVALKQAGWPRPFVPESGPDAPDPALVLGLMRQESSFDAGIVSHAGAVGLMQLMPDTARQAGGRGAALSDPATNMRLGEVYLQSLLTQFGGVVPYALAAYNAGPHRARAWITANGDAAATGDADAMLDWIEMIPFGETRNYVQRVLENRTIYANPQ